MLGDRSRGGPIWRHVAGVMAADYEAPEAWRTFTRLDESVVLRVVDRVRQAFEQTQNELRRPKEATTEQAALALVSRLAGELKAAIRASPLPHDWVAHGEFELSADGLPDVAVDIGWHSLRRGGYDLGYPLAVCDVLDWAVTAVDRHRASLPPRASKRRHPETGATQIFVRHLAWHFGREFGEQRPTTIAHIASAIFSNKEALTAKQVEGFLQLRPAEFTPRSVLRSHATKGR